ncbi:hypothetical protein [Natrinema halophilum]|uniref:Uncharacterized protein n=1 Tax=Natrinema halophilum TaxID=1699371 RepID=A0A7D5KEU6_9EURY|nr:hypothetical protein [Natrinema halophilum]QLG50381.1 hypothetical protein HYG82_16775 [Natrinema halophilum]
MDTDLLAFGFAALALGLGFLIVARRLSARLEVAADVRRSLRLLTGLIAAILVLTGLGLLVVGVVSSSAMNPIP